MDMVIQLPKNVQFTLVHVRIDPIGRSPIGWAEECKAELIPDQPRQRKMAAAANSNRFEPLSSFVSPTSS